MNTTKKNLVLKLACMIEIDEFLKAFIASHGVDEKDFKSSSRVRDLVDLRSVYCAVVKDLGDYTLSDIGKSINRNHATVIHAVKNYRTLEQFDKSLRNKYNKACNMYRALLEPTADTVGLIDTLLASNRMLRTKLTEKQDELALLKTKYKKLRKEINNLTELI